MNFHDVAVLLAANAEDVCRYLLPGGKLEGSNWAVGSVDGDKGRSLQVAVRGDRSGLWIDRADSDEQRGDLLTLWSRTRHIVLAEAADEAARFLNVRPPSEVMPHPARVFKRPVRPKAAKKPHGPVREWCLERGLSEATLAVFHVGEIIDHDQHCVLFPTYDLENNLANIKHRVLRSDRMWQEKDAAQHAFGWPAIGPDVREIVISEGEFDAMSFHERGIPAISMPSGAGNLEFIENDWPRLERYEFVIATDHDAAGNTAAEKLIKRLGPERCRRIAIPTKDANEWLMAGATREQFIQAVRDAKALDPRELKDVGDSDIEEKTLARMFPGPDQFAPPIFRLGDEEIPYLQIEPREITEWTGYSGHGKSLLLSQFLLGQIEQGAKVCVFSGEMPADVLMERAMHQASGLGRMTAIYTKAIFAWLRGKMYVFDDLEEVKLDRLIEVFVYAQRRYDVTQVVIDSLMCTDVPEDGPGFISAQKEAMRKLMRFAKASGCHVHLVVHPRKPGITALRTEPEGHDIAGSGKLFNLTDNCLSVYKYPTPDPDDENAKPNSCDATLTVKKRRNGLGVDRRTRLWFDERSQQFRMSPRNLRPKRYVEFEGAPVFTSKPEAADDEIPEEDRF